MSENAAGFLDKFVPDGVDVTEIIQMALSGLDWVSLNFNFCISNSCPSSIDISIYSQLEFYIQGALFTPDTVEDCDGFDPEYFGEEEGEEEQDLGH